MNLRTLIEENVDSMAQRWLEIVSRHSGTPTYHNWQERDLHKRACDVYGTLAQLLSKPTLKKQVRDPYLALGRQRAREGFTLSEVIQAMIITRRVLWFKVQSVHLLEETRELEHVIDLYNRVLIFFDRAIFYTAQGFEEEASQAGKKE